MDGNNWGTTLRQWFEFFLASAHEVQGETDSEAESFKWQKKEKQIDDWSGSSRVMAGLERSSGCGVYLVLLRNYQG